MTNKRKIVIAITGASGCIYALHLVKNLHQISNQIEECVLIFSDNGLQVWNYELPNVTIENLGFKVIDNHSLFAAPASGSANFDTMIVCPCSMGTLSRISQGISNDLIGRAADVMLKENKKLILVPRESPFNLIHLRNMEQLSAAGAIIMPASPSFYNHPKTMNELIDDFVKRIVFTAGFAIEIQQWS